MDTKFYILKYQRTEYAKKIRKEYEAGIINEHRCNLRQRAAKKADYANTITTVAKDNMIVVGTVK